jgi:hypothetical protein
MEFTGEFETHITIGLDDSDKVELLQQWGACHGLKCLHIVLDRGLTVSQPMLTRRAHGTLSKELASASKLCNALNDEGFHVTRIKIEAALSNQEIPRTRAEVLSLNYFEHHVKVLLRSSADLLALAELAVRHSAHLSRNALASRGDGCHERFITQRCPSVGLDGAREQLDALLKAIVPSGHQVLDVEEEYVVYDSNLAIDDGWIQSKE